MKRFFIIILLLANIAAAIALGLSYLSPHVDPAENYWFSLFGLVYPVLLIANIFFIILWLIVDYRMTIISILTILIGINHVPGFYTINAVEAPTPGDLNVLSYNISNGAYYDRYNNVVRTNLDSMIQAIGRVDDLDIITIQEGSANVAAKFKKFMPDYNVIRIKDRRTHIITKLPVIDSGLIDFGQKTNSCVWADVMYNNQKVRVYSIHLSSNNVTTRTNTLLQTGDVRERTTWSSMKDLLRKYKNSAIQRSQQADLIIRDMERFDGPVLVCGDYNDTPMSYVIHKMKKGLKDSYVTAGSGYSWTFSGTIPLLRIDYILYSDDFNANKFSVLNQSFSDHYPIIGSYKLK